MKGRICCVRNFEAMARLSIGASCPDPKLITELKTPYPDHTMIFLVNSTGLVLTSFLLAIGLGLVVTHKIIFGHQGTIDAESTP